MTINIKKLLRLTLLFSLTFLMITAFSQTKSAGEIIARGGSKIKIRPDMAIFSLVIEKPTQLNLSTWLQLFNHYGAVVPGRKFNESLPLTKLSTLTANLWHHTKLKYIYFAAVLLPTFLSCRNHFYKIKSTHRISTVNNNACKKIIGKVVLYAIFVDTKETHPWTAYDIKTTLDSIQKSTVWITA